jgi:hypothetical protein
MPAIPAQPNASQSRSGPGTEGRPREHEVAASHDRLPTDRAGASKAQLCDSPGTSCPSC